MNFYTDEGPIIACSTGSFRNTAIAVIRLSGFDSLLSLQKFFSRSLKNIKPRFSYLTDIVFLEKKYDNGLIVFFPKGKSYTGENILEISIHGNLLNTQNILSLFSSDGDFRLAHPGEFTYRALKNKKLLLSQVEGLDMLLNANSNLMLSQGLDILQGELHTQYLKLHESFIKLKGAVEIAIDFSEDVGEEQSYQLIIDSFTQFNKNLESLYLRTQGNISSLLSPELVLVGETNAGKSSLFNLLLKHDRSIVSPIAGTTRDYISEIIQIDGTNYQLVDTAGIRDSNDSIEMIGVDRALQLLSRAFFKVLIINPFETNPEYLERLAAVSFDLVIFSHVDKNDFLDFSSQIDLKKIHSEAFVAANFKSGSIEPLGHFSGSIGPIARTAESGSIEPVVRNGESGSIEPLIKAKLAEKFKRETELNPILLERHRACISSLYSKSSGLSSLLKDFDDVAVISSEISILGLYLTELIGIVSPDDVLNSIFSNFCIGK